MPVGSLAGDMNSFLFRCLLLFVRNDRLAEGDPKDIAVRPVFVMMSGRLSPRLIGCMVQVATLHLLQCLLLLRRRFFCALRIWPRMLPNHVTWATSSNLRQPYLRCSKAGGSIMLLLSQ